VKHPKASSGVFDADVFDIADDPDGEDDALDGEIAPLPYSFDARDDILAVALQCGDGGTGVDLDPLFFEGLAVNAEISSSASWLGQP
jgi:hypothetical protein